MFSFDFVLVRCKNNSLKKRKVLCPQRPYTNYSPVIKEGSPDRAPKMQDNSLKLEDASTQLASSMKRLPKESHDDMVPRKKYKSTEKMPAHSLRYDGNDHLPKIDKSRTVRCKNEGCNKKSQLLCSKCNVHLCLCIADDRNCFTEFHIVKRNV